MRKWSFLVLISVTSDKRLFPFFIFGLILTHWNVAYAQNIHENVLYAFSGQHGDSVTVSSDTLQNTLCIRWKSDKRTCLAFTDNLNDTVHKCIYRYYFRGGGVENDGLDLNSIVFADDHYHYTIYCNYSAILNEISTGVLKTDLNTGNTEEILGLPETISGSLVTFRCDPIIPIEEE